MPWWEEEWIAPLAELSGEGASRFGGKAQMLARMIEGGFQVLPGVAVSAEVYDRALERAGAAELARSFWTQADPASPSQELSAEIAARLEEADLSDLASSLLVRLSSIGVEERELIIRSSATGEDSAQLSYAGQFESHRCAAEPAAVEAAIAAAWKSCTASHVAAYRSALLDEDELNPSPPSMGLVVQPYRQFTLSGLLFSSHPTVSLRGWLLLEYLDEQPSRLVGGEVVPHLCRVNLRTGQLLWERRVSGRAELEPEMVTQLIEGSASLVQLAGGDVDVEWGADDGSLIYLQCRPATTKAGMP